MKYLSEEELMNMLETRDPEEIKLAEKDRLDEAGRILLDALSEDIKAGREVFEEFGRQFREADEEPEITEPSQVSETSQKELPVIWFRRATRVPHWAMAAAASLAFLTLLPQLIDIGDYNRTRGAASDIDAIREIDRQLVPLLLEKAELYLQAGNEQGKRKYYLAALHSLEEVEAVDADNRDLLQLMARVHEKLGNNRKANHYYDRWNAADPSQIDGTDPAP